MEKKKNNSFARVGIEPITVSFIVRRCAFEPRPKFVVLKITIAFFLISGAMEQYLTVYAMIVGSIPALGIIYFYAPPLKKRNAALIYRFRHSTPSVSNFGGELRSTYIKKTFSFFWILTS